MFLGVSGNAVVELRFGMLDGGAVDEETLIEAVDLLNQLRGMRVAAGGGGEHLLVAGLIATQQQQVADA